MRNSYIYNEVKDYILIGIGACLYALGFSVFMLPYGLTTGGVAGIASIVYYATGIEVQNVYVTINVCFLLVAIKVLGFRFCLKTIYGVAMVTIALWAWQRLIEEPDPANLGEMILPKLIGEESFMACVLGAIICGFGLYLCFENNGSTGGTDIIAAIVNKYKSVSLGSVIMMCDVVIISSCYFVFHDWARVIYGFVMLFVCSVTLDYCIRRQHQSVQFMIFSRNYQTIADAINATGHGVTILDGEGWFTKSERKVIVTIVRKHDSKLIMRQIKAVDPYSFVSVSETDGVYGEAFDAMKMSAGKGMKHRHIVVYATDDEEAVAEIQSYLGDDFEVRTFAGVGCDTSQPINAVMHDGTAKFKACHIKKFYGFDGFAKESDGKFTLVQGNYAAREYDIHEHVSIEQLRDYLKPSKGKKNRKKKNGKK